MTSVEFGRIRIVSEANCWAMQERRKITKGPKAGEMKWTPFAWFGKMEQALSALLDMKLRDSGARSAAELADALAQAKAEIKGALVVEVAR